MSLGSNQSEDSESYNDTPGVDPQFVKIFEPFLEGLYKYYFRCDLDGWENIPESTALFVGNHNGLLTFEVLMLFYAWWKRFEGKRQALGLAHNVALKNPLFRWIIPKLGAIPASPERALGALKEGHSLLVFPGGRRKPFVLIKKEKRSIFFSVKDLLN